MNAGTTTGCDVFIRDLMEDVSPQEVPLIPDYKSAINASKVRHVEGLEFGLDDIAGAALGPLVILAGSNLFSDLGRWAMESTEEVFNTYIKKGSQKLLSYWLDDPKKGGLKDILTAEGKNEVLALVRSSFKGKKVPKEKVDKVIAALERRLFNS